MCERVVTKSLENYEIGVLSVSYNFLNRYESYVQIKRKKITICNLQFFSCDKFNHENFKFDNHISFHLDYKISDNNILFKSLNIK